VIKRLAGREVFDRLAQDAVQMIGHTIDLGLEFGVKISLQRSGQRLLGTRGPHYGKAEEKDQSGQRLTNKHP